ncbi:MAG: hypothetical protein HOV87_05010 [Catenulispora sp.]|nr:hypothetical protein [Catenulispora sp.]
MSDRQRRPAGLGEYELEGGAFGAAAEPGRERRDQRNTHGHSAAERALARPGSLWGAVLRRIRSG